MNIVLYKNNSAKNKIDKSLTQVGNIISGTLKNDCSVSDPVIMFELTSFPEANYMYIAAFNRYYFIRDIVNNNKNMWTISAHVDVLNSFKTDIKELTVILEETEKTGADNYIDNNTYVSTVKTKTDIKQFPSGLSSSGTFILITAGGEGS